MRRGAVIIWLTAVTLFITGRLALAISMEEAYRRLDQGNAYHKQGNYKEAVKEYKIAWEEGKLLDACYNLAIIYDHDLNENKLAVKYYSEFLTAAPFAPETEEIRSMEEKARQEIKQSAWWFDKQEQEQTKQEHEALLAALEEQQRKDALILEKERPEDSYPGLSHVCLGCHAGFMGPQISMASTHPNGRVPKDDLAKTVPKNVRFYMEGQVICLSCHNQDNLHFEMGTPGINYKYLRVDAGPKGEDMPRFCAFCHSSKSARRFLPGEDGEERRSLELRRR